MRFLLLSVLLSPAFLAAQGQDVSQPQPWVIKSNRNAQLLLTITARYAPESAGSLGVTGLDDQISQQSAGLPARSRRDLNEALGVLRSRMGTEKDPSVQQDLQILVKATERSIHESEVEEQHLLPYRNVAQLIFLVCRRCSVIRLRQIGGKQPLFDCAATPE